MVTSSPRLPYKGDFSLYLNKKRVRKDEKSGYASKMNFSDKVRGINGVWRESICLGVSDGGVSWGGSLGGGLVDNHRPALGSTFGISGSSHKTRSLCTPLGSMVRMSGSAHKARSMCTPWELHQLHIAGSKVPQRLTCKACELPNVGRLGRGTAVDSTAFQADTAVRSALTVFRALKLRKACFRAFSSLSSSLPGK